MRVKEKGGEEAEGKNTGRKNERKEWKEANKGEEERNEWGWKSLHPWNRGAHILSKWQKSGGGEAS